MLEVQGLSKSFYGTPAVEDVSFRVETGEILGFLGPNGAGKTTTMRMITGFLPPTAGRVLLADVDVTEKPLAAKRELGYLPETLALYPEMRVREYVAFRAALCGVPASARRARVDEAIQKCFVDDVATKPIGNLSKGYRQRVGPRGGARPPPEGPRPRRADRRPRPAADRQGARPHPRPEEGPHGPPLDAHPSRGRGPLRPRPHHRPRAHRGVRNARHAPPRDVPGAGRHARPQGRGFRGGRGPAPAPGRHARGPHRRGRRDARVPRGRGGLGPARAGLPRGPRPRLDAPRAHAAPGLPRGRLRAPRVPGRRRRRRRRCRASTRDVPTPPLGTESPQ